MEEEVYILGATLLENPKGSLCNRRDAHDEKSLRELLNFLGVYVETKDTADARQDQQRIHEGDNVNPEKYQGTASYEEEKEIFFQVLSSIKILSGYSSNINGIINMAEKKFQNLKSHDCHVIMTQLLSVALRGLLPENVRVPIVKLCAFLNAISQK